MNDIEGFIEDHLESFDHIEQPDVDLFWQDFVNRKQMPAKDKPNRRLGMTLFFGLLLCGALFFQYDKDQSETQWMITNLEELDPELSKYQMMIQKTLEQQHELLISMDINPKDHRDVYQSLDELDRITIEYKADLKEFGPQPRIIKALLKCAKQRVRLYELILFETELKAYQDELESRT